MIATGTAPHLLLESSTGAPVELPERNADQDLLIYFMRSTTCAVCNRHVADLERRAADLAARGVRIVVAVPEGAAAAASWKAKKAVPFDVVSGRSGTPHEAIGLTRKVFGSVQQSGTVLLDRSGVVRYSHAATNPMGSFDPASVDAAIADLRSR